MAQERITIIRDAEVENTIRAFGTPLFEAAGLSPEAVSIRIIKSKDLNAFVAGGQNLYMHTGLLIRTDTPTQVIGVIAHETGHIAGGHLARIPDALEKAQTQAIIATVLGAAAGVASGRGDVGSAIMMGGSDAALKGLLSFSRAQESSADQAALSYLDSTGQSSRGLLEFFQILGDQELLVAARQDPYVRTHPLTRDRVAAIQSHVDRSPYANVEPRPEWVEMHRRMRAKLFAFTEPPIRTAQRYKDSDTSLDARYARAIAAYRKPDLETALPLIDSLIAERPRDPYFWELKGQMLFENARPQEALAPWRKSVELLPDSDLLRVNLGQLLVSFEDPALMKEAEEHLEFAVRRDPSNSFAWRLLGTAYDRTGQAGMASYALAEYALLRGELSQALYHAGRAEQTLPKGSPARLKVQDLRARAEQVRDKRDRER